jgi:hypothetical protein
MFEQFKRKLRGVLSSEELVVRSDQHLEREIRSMKELNVQDHLLGTLDDNPKWLEGWRKTHQDILRRLADCTSRHEHLISLRRETMELIQGFKIAQPFVLTGSYPDQKALSEDDKRILSKRIHPDKSYEDVILSYFEGYVLSEASCRCLRLFSSDLGDVKKDDWFDTYSHMYGSYIKASYENMIAIAKGNSGFADAAVIEMMTNEAKAKILQGE